MADTKVTVRLPVMRSIIDLHAKKYSVAVGDQIIESARAMIATGQSPVLGYGRFEEYSGSKRSIRSKAKSNSGYPYNVQKQYPNKKVRPVNLELSGEMLDALEVRAGDTGPRIGIFDAEMADRARTHNLGDESKGIPERHFWPTRPGETFTVTIQRAIKDAYTDILSKILQKNNKT